MEIQDIITYFILAAIFIYVAYRIYDTVKNPKSCSGCCGGCQHRTDRCKE